MVQIRALVGTSCRALNVVLALREHVSFELFLVVLFAFVWAW